MLHTNIMHLVFEIRAYYLSQKPEGWAHLAELAQQRMFVTSMPLPSLDVTIYYGAHVAIQEEVIVNNMLWDHPLASSALSCSQGIALWKSPFGAIGLACHYGVVLKKASRSVMAADLANTLEWLNRMRMPVPSAEAVIQAAHTLGLEITPSRDELCAHITRRLPFYAFPPLPFRKLAL